MMSIFEDKLPMLQGAIFAKEYDQHLSQPCRCGSSDAIYRCPSCAHAPLECRPCILAAHKRTPWHHIDKWNGKHFVRTSLHHLGYCYYLGHGGESCTNSSSSLKEFVVVHNNGFHTCSFQFCQCQTSNTEADQLLHASLFPSTFERPETVFTFELLDSFEKISLKSKISAYDYHLSLQEMTNAAFPQDVPVRGLNYPLNLF